MGHVFLLAFDGEGPYQLGKKLRVAGHRVTQSPPKVPDYIDLLRQQRVPPDVFVGDCWQRPSQVREAGAYIRSLKAYRDTPFLLLNVRTEDEAASLARIPGARLTPADRAFETVSAVLQGSAPAPSRAV